MTEPWPEDCVQFCCNSWWEHDSSPTLVRGRLLWTFVAFPEAKPHRLVPEDRGDDPKDHSRFRGRIEPYDGKAPAPAPDSLPVPALPLHEGEDYFIQRGKTRPVVIVGNGSVDIPSRIRGGGARWQTSPRVTVAPYFSAHKGWNPPFVERIRRAEWPQYFWDRLPPSPRTEGSILRLDQLFPMGRDETSAYRITEYRLSSEALSVLDEWLLWVGRGGLNPNGALGGLRSDLMASRSSRALL